MSRYIATVIHPSFGSVLVKPVGGSLPEAKRNAVKKFGANPNDCMILIRDTSKLRDGSYADVAMRKVESGSRWIHYEPEEEAEA